MRPADLLGVYDAFGRSQELSNSSTLETLDGTSDSLEAGATPVCTTIVWDGDEGSSEPPRMNLPILAVMLRKRYNPKTKPPEAAIPSDVALYLIICKSVS